MPKTFFFYDLETSGLSGREDRIMQFAGIRTDMDLNQIGEPVNLLVTLNDDVLPSPDAIMVTGISPQQTKDDGYSEAEFARILAEEIFTPDTITVGFNNIRFDDEFIRHLFWRNFYDPYEWSWQDGRSRWDLLDVVRMTRALRPDGIVWPVDDKGQPTNRLELLSRSNNLEHTKAHDALSDVEALIGVTKLIKQQQPQLYEYLLKLRDKNEVKKLVNLDFKQPFVYVSGRLDAEFNKATVALPLTAGKNGNVVVYDLRYDPTPFLEMNSKDLLGDGIVLNRKDKYITVRIYSHNFDESSGGVLFLDTLYNGVNGQRKEYVIEATMDGSDAVMTYNKVAFNRMHFVAKRSPILGVIGIEKVNFTK